MIKQISSTADNITVIKDVTDKEKIPIVLVNQKERLSFLVILQSI